MSMMGDSEVSSSRSQLMNTLVSSGVCSKKQVEVQICPFCDAEFPTRLEVMHHITTRHLAQAIRQERREAWVCNLCNATHLKFETLHSHIAQQHGDVTYSEFVPVKEDNNILTLMVDSSPSNVSTSLSAINRLRCQIDQSSSHNDKSNREINVSHSELVTLKPEIGSLVTESTPNASSPILVINTLKAEIDADETCSVSDIPIFDIETLSRSSSSDNEESQMYEDLDESQMYQDLQDNTHNVDTSTEKLENQNYENKKTTCSKRELTQVTRREGLRSASRKRYNCAHCFEYFSNKSSCEKHMHSTHLAQEENTPSSDVIMNRYKKTDFTGITVAKMVFKSKNSRSQRCNYCYYCNRKETHIVRHLDRHHCKETLVAKALTKPKGGLERRTIWKEIRMLGNMKHNAEVLAKKKGVLRPVRRSRVEKVAEDFLPCLFCHGLYSKKDLLKHQKSCTQVPTSEYSRLNRRFAKSTAQVAMYAPKNIVSSPFAKDILGKMINDDIHRMILNDEFILKLGESQYALGKDIRTAVQNTKNTIRECARLLLEVRKLESSVMSFKQLLCVKHWDLLVNAAVNLVRSVGDTSASVAVKLGLHIAKIADLILRNAVDNNEDCNDIEEFKKLRDVQWKKCVTQQFERKVRAKTCDKVDLMSLAEDLRILTVFIKDNIAMFVEQIKTGNAYEVTWLKLAKFLLARLAIFNRQRMSDVAAFQISEFENRTLGAIDSSELSSSECHFASTMYRCDTVGSRSRDVAVLMTQDMVNHLNLLLETRTSVGRVPSDNLFMFANKFAYCTEHLSIKCLRDIAKESKANNQQLIRSPKLRSHIAIISRLLDLGQTELHQLAYFMNLRLDFEENYSHVPETTLKVCKMSLILHHIDRDTSTYCFDKPLDAMDLYDIPGAKDALPLSPIDENASLDVQVEEARPDVSATLSFDLSEHLVWTSAAETPNVQPSADQAKRQRTNYSLWTAEENAALERGFFSFYASLERPRQKDFEDFMMNEAAAMANRSIKNVRDKVQTDISKLRKMHNKKL